MTKIPTHSAAALAGLHDTFGPEVCDPDPVAESFTAYGGEVGGRPLAALRPRSPDEVAAIVRYCVRERIAMVPQGGLTGLAGGAVPTAAQAVRAVLVCLARLKKIRTVDPVNRTIAVDAGCTVEGVEAAAGDAGLVLPFRIGSGGSAQIGGIIATNAGGIRSWRHGTIRHLVLGLEAVLADGTPWSSMRAVRKANLGIDVGGLLIGSEGILGIITGAVLQLAARPRTFATAFLAVTDVGRAVQLFRHFDAIGDLEVFELMSRTGLAFLSAADPDVVLPAGLEQPWYVLAEWATSVPGQALDGKLEDALAEAMGIGLVADGTIARNDRERDRLWQLRERHGAACRRAGRPVQHDVAVPLSALAEFVRRASVLAEQQAPGWRPVPICHVGDGNVHFDIVPPSDGDDRPGDGLAELRRAIHDLAESLGGAFSAEHGIGTTRADELQRLAPAGNIAAMTAIKRALDPHNLMNPGKVLI